MLAPTYYQCGHGVVVSFPRFTLWAKWWEGDRSRATPPERNDGCGRSETPIRGCMWRKNNTTKSLRGGLIYRTIKKQKQWVFLVGMPFCNFAPFFAIVCTNQG